VNNAALLGEGGGLSTGEDDVSVILNNSTVAGNQAQIGGGIAFDGELTLNSSSIISNTATYRGGGFEAAPGGLATIQNTLLAENSALTGQNCYGVVASDGYNLVDSTAGCDFTSSSGDVLGVGAQLGTLVSSQGYVPLLSGSPAVEGGNPAGCEDHEGSPILVDQRGVSRSGICDIGAYEYMASGTQTGVQSIAGDGQQEPPGGTFSQNLTAFVHDADGNPVQGITVTFTAPGSGASGTFADTVTNTTTAVTGADGIATATSFTANSIQGAYVVTASISSPSESTEFNLENLVWYVSPDGNDSLDCRQIATAYATIDGVQAKVDFSSGDLVQVESGTYTKVDTQVVYIDESAIISGGWNADFTEQVDHSHIDCENQDRTGVVVVGGFVTMDHFVVKRCGLGGMALDSWVELEDMIIRDNEGSSGAGISNYGTMILRNSSVRANHAEHGGGGICNSSGIALIEGSYIQENSASSDNYGGGIYNTEELFIRNSTISGNTAPNAGGIYSNYASDWTEIINSTITNNTATDGEGGGLSAASSYDFIIVNSIDAGNLAASRPDGDAITSEGYNLIGIPDGINDDPSDIISVDPYLTPQLVNGGPDVIYALMPESPAIDAANPAVPGSDTNACLEADQRGVSRPLDGDEDATPVCDIGAYELDPADPPTIPDPGPEGARRTFTSQNTDWLPGSFLCDQMQASCTDGSIPHADAAHSYAGDTYAFYATHHGRDSYDDEGGIIVSSVHVGVDYYNAAWTGLQVIYGDGDGSYGYPLADDVVAHELTHGVTQYTSGLFYYYQSGAINESFSDLWGEFVDLTNGEGNDDPSVRWLVGDDISGSGAGRDMSDPTTFNDPDRMTSSYYYTGYADLYSGYGDSGGVHTNSGVNNKAVYLMTDGDSFNGQTVTGLGIDKVADIYYEVQTSLLTSGADYGDLFNALYQGCLNLVGGAEGITLGDCTEVKQATLAVEMNKRPVTGYNPEASVCEGEQVPINLFYDDLESGIGNWVSGAEGHGTDSWDHYDQYAISGTHSIYGTDEYDPTDTHIAMDLDVSLAPGSQPYLHFNHAFGFEEPDFDGGWLEYSTDGGSSWTDAGSLFDDGLDYTGAINTLYPEYGDNIHTGQVAFVGDSHGYVSSRYDLSSLAGQDVRFRWRFSTDSSYHDWGWWVDDVRIYTCSETPSLAYAGYIVDDDMIGDSAGNGDGVANCGETIELMVDLENLGTASATGVSATLTSVDNHIVGAPYSGVSDYPDIIESGIEQNTSPYLFTLEASIPYGYTIPFTLASSADVSGPWSDDFWLFVACGTPAVSNDDIYDAEGISSAPYSNSQSTSDATLTGDDPPIKCIGYEQGYNSVWYSYTPASNGVITVDTFGSEYDTVLALWTGTRGSLNRITANCDDDSDGTLQSEVRAGVAAGTQIYIEVVGKTVDDYGTLNLSLSQAANPTISARNGSFESDADGNGIPNAWNGKLLTASDERVCNQAVAESCSFLMAGIGENKLLKQTELAGGDAGEQYTLSGWGRSTNADGAGPFAIRVVVKYLDGTKGVFRINFGGGTHGWQYSQMNFTTEKAYTRMLLSLMYGKAGGTVWFDDVRMDPVP